MKSTISRILPRYAFITSRKKLKVVRVWNGPSSTVTLSAESKQARMFVILLTAQESGPVILGMLIGSRGKVCLCLLTQGKCKKPYWFLQVKTQRKRREFNIHKTCWNYHLCDTQGRKLTFSTWQPHRCLSNMISRVENNLHMMAGFLPNWLGEFKTTFSLTTKNSPALFGGLLVLIFPPRSAKNTHLKECIYCSVVVPVTSVSCIVSTPLNTALLHNTHIKGFKRKSLNVSGKENHLVTALI